MITRLIPLAFLALLASSALSASADAQNQTQSQGKTVAVVIGVSKYAKLGGGQQLQFADRDALLVAEALKKTGVSADNLRLLAAQEATVAAIKSAIGDWLARKAGAEDTAIIFFSGHGLFEQEFGEAYLLGADSDAREPFSTALSLNEIKQALTKRVRARRVLLITDAIRRDFFDPDTNQMAAAAFIQGLDQLASGRDGLAVIAASGPNEFSREGQRWNGQGVFSKHLAAGLTTGQYIDRNNDGALSADELFDVLARLVAEDTSNKQHAWHSASPLAQIEIASISRETSPPASISTVIPATKPEPHATPHIDTIPPSETKATTKAVNPSPPLEKKPTQSDNRPVEAAARPARPSAGAQPVTGTPEPRKPEATRVTEKIIASAESPVASPVAGPAVKPMPAPVTPARAPATAPPAGGNGVTVESANQPSTSAGASSLPALESPRAAASLPRLGEVAATPERNGESVAASSPPLMAKMEAAPSPLILQLEAAIAAKRLLEPKSASAWDLYQKLASDPATSSEAARLRPALAEALIAAGRGIVGGDVCSDTIADRIDDFRRAGQFLARSRSLKPENTEIGALEKLSAAEALIALQFYEEAERALTPLQTAKLAAVENAMGLVHQGMLDNFRAERAYKRAAEIDPNWAVPHYNLALLYRSQQNLDALAELEQAAALNGKNVRMLVALGDEYFSRQQWPRAAENYSKAITINPNDDTLHTKLGHALYSQGLQTEANREYQKARELHSRQQ